LKELIHALQQPAYKPISVVLIDKNFENLESLRTALSTPSYQLKQFKLASDAFEFLNNQDVTVVLIDSASASVLLELAQLQRFSLIVLTSYEPAPTLIKMFFEMGADDVLRKTLDPYILQKKIGQFAQLADRSITPSSHPKGALKSINTQVVTSQLRLEKEFLEAAFESIDDGIVACDANGVLIYFNQTTRDFNGSGESAVSAEDWAMTYRLYQPDGVTLMKKNEVPLYRALKNGKVTNAELVVKSRSGTERRLLANGKTLHDPRGKLLGAVVVQRDITQTVINEEKLSLSDNILRQLPDGIIVTDLKGIITHWTGNSERIFGYSATEAIGQSVNFTHRQDVKEKTTAEIISTVESTGRFHGEINCVKKDGTEIPIELMAHIFFDSHGKPSFLVGLNRDITERKKIEVQKNELIQQTNARREAEKLAENFRLLAESTPQLAWAADPQGNVFWYNQKWLDYTGTTLSEVAGSGWHKIQDPKYLPLVLERLAHSLTTGEPFEMEFPMRRADGVFRWFLTRISPMRGNDGKIISWFGTNTDIEELRQTQEALRESLQAREMFLSIASHELKTPLTSMRLQTEIRQRALAKGDLSRFTPIALEKLFAEEIKQIDRLNRLVEDMLDISRLRTGKLTLQFLTFDLCGVVSDVVSRLNPQFEAAHCKVMVQGQCPVIGRWDRYRLEQVVTNLLTNAIKYAPAQPIEIAIKTQNNDAVLSVKDHGLGIAMIDQKRIFDQFERAASANEASGLGLGLFITKQIVEIHRGTISLQSERGRGSTFTIRLPLQR